MNIFFNYILENINTYFKGLVFSIPMDYVNASMINRTVTLDLKLLSAFLCRNPNLPKGYTQR